LLDQRSVLVIDEAGMIGTRQMERVIAEAQKRGAKVVLVGDPQQLQAIEAGAAFRSIAERHGGIEVTQIRRQREDWQRDATRQLATGRTGEAVRAYEQAGHVHAADTSEQARDNLIDRWDKDRIASPDASRIILTHTNDAVRDLNLAARERRRAAGELGEDIAIIAERGNRTFASGDRIMFLKNERGLGVKNGSLGTVQSLTVSRMAVTLDDGRSIAFDTKDYNQVDHGYAATIHKAQGVTVDRVHVLATPGLDSHATYVALSRHRDRVDLHYGNDDFADQTRLVRALSRERGKDMASDYAVTSTRAPDPPAIKPATRDPFAGLRLKPAPAIEPQATPLDKAVERYARATADIWRMRGQGLEELPHQRQAFRQSVQALDAVRPQAARDLREAFTHSPELVADAAKGRTAATIRAMALEADARIAEVARRNAEIARADKFVAEWQRQAGLFRELERSGEVDAASRVEHGMMGMAKNLERDPQLESLLRNRVKDLGIQARSGASLSHDLQDWLGISRSRGLGR
jgi:transposase-like protein